MLFKSEKRSNFLSCYWLLLFYIFSISYLELVYKLWLFRSMSMDFLYPIVFSIGAAVVMFFLSSAFSKRINMIIGFVLMLLLIICYGVQLFYFCIFRTPLSFYSLTGAGEAMKFNDIIFSVLHDNLGAVFLLLIPLFAYAYLSVKFDMKRMQKAMLYKLVLLLVTSYAVSLMCVNFNSSKSPSPRALYYEISAPDLSVSKLGLLTTMRLDVERLIFGFDLDDKDYDLSVTDEADLTDKGSNDPTDNPTTTQQGANVDVEVTPTPSSEMQTGKAAYNILNIDFKALIANEKSEKLLSMHKFFASAAASKKNQYTGMFKGNNLILITAESFSPYAISKELTPTLYKMSTEGFVFKNFYNPVWGVSTSDGEYAACTGLIPKSGVWSFAQSGKIFMPFVMGNQFKNLGYMTNAYHDHTYTYYSRNISHPNMGYVYKALGNGLDLKKTWPESDVEMVNATAKEYIGKKPFHVYYMSVSGHMNYNFSGNYIAYKNRKYVEKLSYSDPSKAYIAANLEFEFAMKILMAKLEAAGIAENTVIAISPDHYPYGLPRTCINELAGHKVENNFELYKSVFILWKKGMKTTVVDKPCASLDINATLSNLFGLNYDSRLSMGTDILSDSAPLVIFSNRSWITDKASYNSVTGTAKMRNTTSIDKAYVKRINKLVKNKFKYSAGILETDYFRKVVPNIFKK